MDPGPAHLIGRTLELDRLEAALDALRRGGPGCVVVTGEPGIGKTRLLLELHRRAEHREHLVLAGAAAEFEREMPFAVWVDALDAYVASRDVPAAAEPGRDLAHLAHVLPSWPGAGASAPALTGERYRSHRAVRALLALLAGDRPLVLTLDDLHWADPASVELVGALLRRPPDAPLLLVLAYRTGMAPPALAGALAAAEAPLLELAPLSEGESAELIGEDAGGRRSASIFGESEGNPFYALELARMAELPSPSSSGDLVAGRAGVPGRVAAALLSELHALTGPARALLDAAAIAGDPFDPDLAFAIAGLDAGAGADALDELLDAALVRTTDVPRRFAFRHPLVRRAVHEATRGGWRLTAHARAAEVLAARGASALARADHVEQSAAHGDAAAIAVLLEAARASAPRSPAGAARWYAAALRLMPEGDGPGRLEVLIELAEALRSIGDHERCCLRLVEALELVPPEDGALRVRLVTACASSELFLGRHDVARRRLAAAADDLPAGPSPEGVVTLLAQATGAFFTTDVDGGCALAAEALAAARALGDPALIGDAAATLAHVDTLRGDVGRAEARREEAATLFDTLADEALAPHLDAVHRLARASLHLERYAEAMRHAARGVAVARATGRAASLPETMSAQAQGALMLGRLALAAELQDAALEAARLAGNDYTTCSLLSTTANIALLKGDVEDARRAGEESVTIVDAAAGGHIVTVAQARLAVTLRELGASAEDTEALVALAGGWALTALAPTWSVPHHEALTRLELAAGHPEDAEQAARRAEVAAGELGLPVATALAARARARVLLAQGDASAAAGLALASAAATETAGARIESARSRALAGAALAAAQDRDGAVGLLRAAEAALHDCGALHDRNVARRELRRLGARVEPRGPAAPGAGGLAALSAREREIAELVTQRKTNRGIAAELYLSEKTVESHLRNIFVKLSASSRVDVARAVERDRGEDGRTAGRPR